MSYKNGNIYPYTDEDLRRDNPRVSFPKSLNNSIRERYGMEAVRLLPEPPVTSGYKVVQDSEPTMVDGEWVLGWTVSQKTEEELESEEEAKQLEGKSECARRILEVADIVTQTNLTANYSVGNLSEADTAVYESGLVWIRAMQAAWPTIISEGRDIYEDVNWPAVPEGVVELASRY